MSDPSPEMLPGPEELINILGLKPLADEGGLWSQVALTGHASAIYYLLVGDDFSALHRLPYDEIYHFYAGAALELLVLGSGRGADRITRPVVGLDIAAGERPAVVVPGGMWQGSRSTGDWTLVGTTMAPAFDFDEFELGNREDLVEGYPDAAAAIFSLTR